MILFSIYTLNNFSTKHVQTDHPSVYVATILQRRGGIKNCPFTWIRVNCFSLFFSFLSCSPMYILLSFSTSDAKPYVYSDVNNKTTRSPRLSSHTLACRATNDSTSGFTRWGASSYKMSQWWDEQPHQDEMQTLKKRLFLTLLVCMLNYFGYADAMELLSNRFNWTQYFLREV